MAKKKLTRKELLKEPDEFLTLTEKLLSWVKLNPKPLVVGGCGLLVVILLVSGYIFYQNNRARVAAELLGQDLSRYHQLTGETDAEKALATVAPDFDRLIDKFGSQPAGKLGCLLYAHFTLRGGNPQKAMELYQKALKAYHQDPSMIPVILYGLASAQQQSGDKDAAIATFEKILALKAHTYKDSALFQLGRLFVQNGQAEKGREMFDRLIADYPDSSYVQLAKEMTLGLSKAG